MDILNYLLETLVPVGHCRLDHDKIERPFFGQEIGEQISRQAEPPKVAGDCFENRRSRGMFAAEPASTPPVGFKLLLPSHKGGQPVEVVEQLKVGLASKKSGHAEQAGGLEPEIVCREVIDRRIHEQNLGLHSSLP